MSGLAVWIAKPLMSFSYETESHVFKIEDDNETKYNFENGTTVTFRKFHHFENNYLSLKVDERASLIIDTKLLKSRFFFNNTVQSFRFLLSIFLPTIPKIWEIEYRGEAIKPVTLKSEPLYVEEILNRSSIHFTLSDINRNVIETWLFNQTPLNEICKLLTESRENIVAETKFTYCTKVLELIYKNLVLPTSIDILNQVRDIMVIEGVWKNEWKKEMKTGDKKINFRIILCFLWQSLRSKESLKNSIANPFKFLEKVHNNRNHYTHYTSLDDVYTPSQLIYVNNILIAFSYALILQFLGFEEKKIELFLKVSTDFLISFDYNSNPYSMNYQQTV